MNSATPGGLQLCQIKWNKEGPPFDCKMKKELLTSVKCLRVGAIECVCYRFLAIDDLSEETMKLHILSGSVHCPLLSAANHHAGVASHTQIL